VDLEPRARAPRAASGRRLHPPREQAGGWPLVLRSYFVTYPEVLKPSREGEPHPMNARRASGGPVQPLPRRGRDRRAGPRLRPSPSGGRSSASSARRVRRGRHHRHPRAEHRVLPRAGLDDPDQGLPLDRGPDDRAHRPRRLDGDVRQGPRRRVDRRGRQRRRVGRDVPRLPTSRTTPWSSAAADGPYGEGSPMQYWVPRVVQSGNPAVVHKKGTPAGLALVFTAIKPVAGDLVGRRRPRHRPGHRPRRQLAVTLTAEAPAPQPSKPPASSRRPGSTSASRSRHRRSAQLAMQALAELRAQLRAARHPLVIEPRPQPQGGTGHHG
jgi:hypothetical protein